MGAIPLHTERRIEQRWAARITPPAVLISPKSVSVKRAVPTSRRTRKQKKNPVA